MSIAEYQMIKYSILITSTCYCINNITSIYKYIKTGVKKIDREFEQLLVLEYHDNLSIFILHAVTILIRLLLIAFSAWLCLPRCVYRRGGSGEARYWGKPLQHYCWFALTCQANDYILGLLAHIQSIFCRSLIEYEE